MMGSYNGILVIYKEKGWTSFDVVARLRRILGMKKVGHTGTLDPDAQGVLPVALGKGTKLVDMLTDKDKAYEAVLRLGIDTDTQDMTGNVLAEKEVCVSEEAVRTAIESFLGAQMQIPPMYSALKVGGKKLYELAREGQVIERSPRPVCFHEIRITEMKLPLVRFSVTCSKGTYIRTLCHDIGEKLGCGGCMESLLRTKAGSFTLKDCLTLEQVERAAEEGTLDSRIFSIEETLEDYPRLLCRQEGDRLLANGNPMPEELMQSQNKEGYVRMCASGGLFVGIFKWDTKKERYYPVKMF